MHVRDLAAALKERGDDVTVLAGGGGILFEALAARGVSCRLLEKLVHPIRPLQDGAALLEIRSALGEIRPDIVTTHSNKAGLLGRLAARSLKIPAVHTSHGFLFGGSPKDARGRFYRLVEKVAARAGDRVIAVAESEFKAAREAGVIAPEKMTVVYNGLPELDPPLTADPGGDPPRLVMVARFAEPKDHLTLLQALGGLQEEPWSLTLVGDGEGRGRAENTAAELGIGGRIDFAGVREDVPAILAVSQVFVLSSRREGFPLSVLEAMRAGLPVVASRAGGTGEAVVEGKTGLLFAPGSSEQLQEALLKLLRDPALRRDMGRAGRERFRERFTLEQMVEDTCAVYRSVLGRE